MAGTDRIFAQNAEHIWNAGIFGNAAGQRPSGVKSAITVISKKTFSCAIGRKKHKADTPIVLK